MSELFELFWGAPVEAIKRGYLDQGAEDPLICLICGKRFEKGLVYPDEGLLYEAEKYVRRHIAKEHGPMFNYLLQMNKEYTGLTDLQKTLLGYFYQGLGDQEIVTALGGGSTSTIRNHRFTLRERAKQAKVFLAIMELLGERMENPQKSILVHQPAKLVDERFAITEEESEKFLQAYFKEGPDGPLAQFPTKEKRKIVILLHLIKKFDPDRKYSEPEVNAILQSVYDDYVTLRRTMIDYGLLDRTADGGLYWVKKKN